MTLTAETFLPPNVSHDQTKYQQIRTKMKMKRQRSNYENETKTKQQTKMKQKQHTIRRANGPWACGITFPRQSFLLVCRDPQGQVTRTQRRLFDLLALQASIFIDFGPSFYRPLFLNDMLMDVCWILASASFLNDFRSDSFNGSSSERYIGSASCDSA